MWLVVFKQTYYPSVYECKTKEEARELYDKIKEQQFNDKNDPEFVNEDDKVYMTEIKESFGVNSEDVDWYISARDIE
ncbi:hypothetical protein [Priestia megaterium]|uniref:hypothetical protein n=1 Tax=Priestia megaterium TaxID=1404 RepID=UPI003CC604CD